MELFELLNAAVAREVLVSVQYMLQHTLWSGKPAHLDAEVARSKPGKFIASHSPVYFPGTTLKKIAVMEMKHAEKIAERIAFLGGELSTDIPSYVLGASVKEILEIDKGQEAEAIELYNRIITVARQEGDEVTAALFRKILADEEKHYRTFSNLLALL